MKPVVIASVIARDADHGRRALAAAPVGCALVELRADRLRREAIIEIVRTVGRSCVVSVRRSEEGGSFDGSEQERRTALLAALDAGACFIDVEWNSVLAELARGPTAGRVILSHHGAPCEAAELASTYEAMAATSAARLKIVPRGSHVGTAGTAVKRLLEHAGRQSRPLACFASGRAGAITRLLAPSWGSWATYGSLGAGRETAQGQFAAGEMLGLFDVLNVAPGTRRFGIVGSGVFGSPTPAMHAAACEELGIDARCFPMETDDLDDVAALVGCDGAAGIEALAVTLPFKEVAARRCRPGDDVVSRCGAVNTVLIGEHGWTGFNTDGPAMLELVREWLEPHGARVAIVGAGGTARAAAAVFHAAGADVTVYNRTQHKAEFLAEAFDVRVGDWQKLETAAWDVLVQATPLGRNGERVLAAHGLSGRVVLDAVYGASPTPLVHDARARGLVALDGFDLLAAQGVLQLEKILGRRPAAATLRRAAREWMGAVAAQQPRAWPR